MTPLTFHPLLAFVQRRCRPSMVSFTAFLIWMILGQVPPAHAVDMITVNATTELADTTRRPVGISTNYLMDSERRRLSVPPRTTQAAIQEMGGRFMRYPGGEKSDCYLWSVAPWTNSQPTLARTGPNEWPAGSRQFTMSDNVSWIPGKEPLNFDEFMGICQAAGGEPVLVVCYDSMYKALTTGGTRPTRAQLLTTATEWVRYANVTKGYRVKYWSIGNETDYNTDGNPGATQYATDLIAFSQAMKAIDPTIKIGAQGKSAAWFQTVLTNASAAIDFLDVHEYAGYNWTNGYETFRTTNPVFTGTADLAISAINTYAPVADRTRLKVAVSEMGAHDWAGAWPDANDTGHALVLFDLIGQHLKKTKVDFVQYWNTRWIDNDGFSLPLGSTNLITNNPGFESNHNGWTENFDATAGNSSITTVVGEFRSGTKALKVAGTTAGGRGQDVTSLFAPNTLYTAKVWAKVTGTASYSGGGISFYNGGTKVGGTDWTFTNTTYKEYAASFRSPAAFDYVDIWCYKSGSTDVLYLDDFNVITGALPGDLNAIGPSNELFASGRILSIWGQYLQDRLVDATSTSMVRSYASRSPSTNRLAVFLTNKDTITRSTTVTLQNYPGAAAAQRWVFKGTGPDDVSPTWTQSPDVAVSAGQLSLTLHPVAITVLVFQASPTINTHAAATPSPLVTAAVANLSVIAADDGGEANLTYSWAVTGTPPGPVTFSANGTNAAKNVTATFTDPGTYHFAVSITDGGGLTVNDTLTLSVVQSFALWKQSRFTALELGDAGISGGLADPDHDGAANLLEYSRGANPRIADPATADTGTFDGGNLMLVYQKDTTKHDITTLVEQSTDLATWNTNGVIDTVIIDGSIQTRHATIPATHPIQFLRIKVTQP